MHELWVRGRTSIIELMRSHPWHFRNAGERKVIGFDSGSKTVGEVQRSVSNPG